MKSPADVRREGTPWAELGLVWALFALATVEILVTYWRLPWQELYHVSGSGIEGGASRALLFLNFPVALVAIAVLLVLLDRLPSGAERGLALLAIVLCAAVFWPKIVDQGKLDARPVNAVAAIGVAIALGLTLWSGRRGLPGKPARQRGDPVRLVIVLALVALALPWMAADLGFAFDSVPVLGTLYQTGELRTQPHVAGFHPAVHHGHHHGMDGVLLVVAVLLLSRLLPSVRALGLRGLLGAYLALMLCYGVGNIANDFWLEQVVKRGWTLWEVPDVTTPKASAAWAVIVVAAGCLWTLFVLPTVRRPREIAGAPVPPAR
jgi:hypothetical protein